MSNEADTAKLNLYNRTLTRLGDRRIASLTADDEKRRRLDAAWPNVMETLQQEGPEEGWKFLKKRNIGIDREAINITKFTDYNSIVEDMTLVRTGKPHNLITGNDVEIDDTSNYDGEYNQIVVVSQNEFYIETDYVADDATGYIYWTSYNYQYRYKVPDESDRVLRAHAGGVDLPDWTEEGGYVLTNKEDVTIYIDYLQYLTDPSQWPSYFNNVVVLGLAMELSYARTQSSALQERLKKDYDDALLNATGRDERRIYIEESSTAWIDAGR
jgi:hypothetical protein